MVIDHAVIEYTGGQVIEGSPSATAGIYTAGVKVDIACNVMFSPNTNGLKLSSSGQSETRGQAVANAYNNTIVNAGWRRDGEKGGCIYVEKNCLANVVNNLMVNCKFRAMTPNYKNPNASDAGFDDKSVIDYNMYVSGTQKSPIVYPEESNVAYAYEGYNYKHKSYNPAIDTHSVIATADNLVNPQFANFDINAVGLTDYAYNSNWDFHLTADSPALGGASSTLTPCFADGLVINGKSYQSPALKSQFGAFGIK